MEGREESDLKEEQEKKETGPAEERKEEEEKDSEVKEEKSGAAQRTERKDGNWVKGLLTLAFVTDREKVAEEKEKETPRAAETADAKAKPELLDLKKGGSLARVMAPTHSRPQSGETPSSTSSSSSWPLAFTRTPSSLIPPKTS